MLFKIALNRLKNLIIVIIIIIKFIYSMKNRQVKRPYWRLNYPDRTKKVFKIDTSLNVHINRLCYIKSSTCSLNI